MKIIFRERLKPILEQALPWIVLLILTLYTYAKFFERPYGGFRWDSQTGQIVRMYVQAQGNPTLQLDDRLIKVGPVYWTDFAANLRVKLFEGVQVGQTVPIIVERNGQEITVNWRYPGANRAEILSLLISDIWLAFVFWLVGTASLILIRPKDERCYLIVAFCYLSAIWLAAGSGISSLHVWGAALVLRMGVWLCVPVYLHLHWVFPKTFGRLPPFLLWGIYLGAIALAICEWFQALPTGLYSFGLLLAAGGSVVLLLIHLIKQPEARRDLRLLLFSAILGLLPSVGISVVGMFGDIPYSAGGALLSLPLIPFAYFYAAYRRQLSNLEVRVNRIISIYIFLILVGTIALFPIVMVATSHQPTGTIVYVELGIVIVVALTSIFGFSSFQVFVEYRVLGMPVPPKKLPELYASRIITTTSLSSLIRLLKDEVLPSLLVRQFVFLRLEKNAADAILAVGITEGQIPAEEELASLLSKAGKYRPSDPSSDNRPTSWMRLALPLKIEDELIGFWGFGRHDPDDTYSQGEIEVLQSLANQTAIALSNILQTERLRTVYEANVNRFEEERLRLALDLHDSVLNQLALLRLSLDEAYSSPDFQQAYDKLSHRLREIVGDLRPPMLGYGLKPAIEELAENIMERSKDKLVVSVDIQTDETRYPADIEQHIFRIVQEACENTLRHANAKKVSIYGKLAAENVDLSVEDDGVGFDAGRELEISRLLSSKHFGLAGMVERAELIGAKISIDSRRGRGTKVRVTWNTSQSKLGGRITH